MMFVKYEKKDTTKSKRPKVKHNDGRHNGSFY